MAGIGGAHSTSSNGYSLGITDDPVAQVVGNATASAHAIQQLAHDFNVPAEPIAAAVNKISAGTHASPPDASEIEAGQEDLVTALTTSTGASPQTNAGHCHPHGSGNSDSNGGGGAAGVPAASRDSGAPPGSGASDSAGTPGSAGSTGGSNYDAIAASQPPGQVVSKTELLDRTRQALIAAGMDPAIIERVLARMEQWLDSPAPSTGQLDTTAPVDAAGSPSGADGGGSGSPNGGSGDRGAPVGTAGADGLLVPTPTPSALRMAGGADATPSPSGPVPAVSSLDDAEAGYGKTWTAHPMTTEEIQAFGKEHEGEPATQANIEKWAKEISGKTGIPVELLIADMANESSGNPNAVGDVGAENGVSLGLFQIRENFMDNNGWSTTFPFKMDSQTYKSNPAYQMAAGGSVLAYRMETTGGVKQAFAQHLTGNTDTSPARVQEYLNNLNLHMNTYSSGGDALTAAA
ncbi:MAG: transglycosylase SLT domain-containing protein [Herminiimonas sp.]|nr:transglycosylase SLT domain-containing protein [Herminiimonas sp.]